LPRGRASTLEASDSDAARPFTPTACDTIDALIKTGEIEGEGLLVVREHSDSPVPWIRRGKFPLPWQIGRYLERADTIGSLFGSRTGLRAARPGYMLRRYSPPTSNSVFVICPSEQTRTVFISSAKTLPFSITLRLSFSSAFGAAAAWRE
jgi:hypothetical protein